MKRISLLLNIVLATIQFSYAQVGKQFPTIPVVDLNEKEVTIPADSKGKFTLVGVAFSEDAQKDLYSWSQPVFSMFMDDDNLNSLVYDPEVYLILMFTGVNKIAYNNAREQIKAGTEESLNDNVVMYKGKMEDYRKTLNMKDRKTPHFFVLDKEGKIIYETEGRYSAKELNKVADLIEEE